MKKLLPARTSLLISFVVSLVNFISGISVAEAGFFDRTQRHVCAACVRDVHVHIVHVPRARPRYIEYVERPAVRLHFHHQTKEPRRFAVKVIRKEHGPVLGRSKTVRHIARLHRTVRSRGWTTEVLMDRAGQVARQHGHRRYVLDRFTRR